MKRLDYRIGNLSLIGNSAFYEASKEELRCLMALIELKGHIEDIVAFSRDVDVSVARCSSALAFWEGSGIISKDDGRPTIVEEFEERLVRGEIDEVPTAKVAETIRDEQLAAMIEECAVMMNQPCLSNVDVKSLVALHTQYALSAEYILTLAAHLQARGSLTVKLLSNEAIKLSMRNITDVEALNAYIIDKEKTSATDREFCRIFGIYGNSLSQSQRSYFKKWSEEFGYSVPIVSEAYDIAVLNTKSGKGDFRYIDKLLTVWHEAGCRTLQDCKNKIEQDKLKRSAEKADTKKHKKTIPDTPRYGNFDINEAFNNAVARSFGTDGDKED